MELNPPQSGKGNSNDEDDDDNPYQNPNAQSQQAALYLWADKKGAFGGMTQLQGKELSYNNIRDLDVAWKAVSAFNRFVKEGNQVSGTDYSQWEDIICSQHTK